MFSRNQISSGNQHFCRCQLLLVVLLSDLPDVGFLLEMSNLLCFHFLLDVGKHLKKDLLPTRLATTRCNACKKRSARLPHTLFADLTHSLALFTTTHASTTSPSLCRHQAHSRTLQQHVAHTLARHAVVQKAGTKQLFDDGDRQFAAQQVAERSRSHCTGLPLSCQESLAARSFQGVRHIHQRSRLQRNVWLQCRSRHALTMWSNLQTTGLMPPKAGIEQLMRSLMFMKVCSTRRVMCTLCGGIDKETLKDWAFKFIKAVGMLGPHLESAACLIVVHCECHCKECFSILQFCSRSHGRSN